MALYTPNAIWSEAAKIAVGLSSSISRNFFAPRDRLKDKVAIITGSTSGIGRAIAELFGEEGAKVVVSASGRRPKPGQEVVKGIKDKGGEAVWCKADVREKKDIKHLISFTKDHFGGLDILVNNAYGGKHGSILDLPEDQWDEMFDTSLKSIYFSCKYALPDMIKAKKGSIINIASMLGMSGYVGTVNYCAVKAAVINLSRQLAVEFGRQGIRVNAISPGRIVTEWKQEYLDKNPFAVRRQNSYYPLGRPGTLRELAYAALFIASDEASFITGHNLVVDGGITAEISDSTAPVVEAGIRKELAEQGIDWPEYDEKGTVFPGREDKNVEDY